MEKLLHERLRKVVESGCYLFSLGKTIGLSRDSAQALADEIEKYYIPRPRFEDGEPIQFDDRLDYGCVRGITFNSDKNPNYRGKFGIIFDSGTLLYNVGEPVKRPQFKVLDADGVEINVGDTVWYVATGNKHIVEELLDDGGIYIDKSSLTWDGKLFTHKEPDSLLKLLDDMYSCLSLTDNGAVRKWADRLSAIIERGA